MPAERIEIHVGFYHDNRVTDIQLTFCADGRFWVYHNSDPIKPMVRSKQSLESLAESPVSYVFLDLGRLTLGWDMASYKFLVQLNGIEFSKLTKFVNQDHICRQKVLHSVEGNIR